MEPAYRWPENGVRPGTDSENSICINKKVVLTYIINLLYILFYVTGEGGGFITSPQFEFGHMFM